MTKNIAIVRISTPNELVTAGESLYNPWFRGHGCDKWRLESSLERDANNFGVPREALWEREQTMLTLFKERAHLYTSEFTAPTTEFEWFSLIRHYGGPSRMLDVSSSYLVATYFALCDSHPKRDAAIWAFQEANVTEKEYPNFDTLFQCNHPLDLKIGSPNRLNMRLQAQSGKFFVPGSINASLESQIAAKFDTDFRKKPTIYRSVHRIKTERRHSIWKFIMPRSAHSELFRFISRCNVRAYSLIPGIDGLAASLREMMRAYD
ncbi:MAG: FRG domain-containing protein [Thermodesulfobacteriota bacterium]